MNRMFPKKETQTQNVLSSVVTLISALGVYKFVWKD